MELSAEFRYTTDPIGSEQMNLRLSQERAQAVQDALLLDDVPRRTIAAAIGYKRVQWHETCDQRHSRDTIVST